MPATEPRPIPLNYTYPAKKACDVDAFATASVLLALLAIVYNGFGAYQLPRSYESASVMSAGFRCSMSLVERPDKPRNRGVLIAWLDAIVSLALAVLLLVSGILVSSGSAYAPPLYRFYIRWKIVFAFIGGIGYAYCTLDFESLTRHASLLSMSLPGDFLIATAVGLTTPLLMLRSLCRL